MLLSALRKLFKSLLFLLLAAALLAIWGFVIEPRWVAAREIAVDVPGWRGPQGLKVAVASDWHIAHEVRRVMTIERANALVDQINAAHPDVVLLPGDFISGRGEDGTTPEDVAAVLGRLKAPRGVYAVLGNHDWWTDGTRFNRALRAAGITVLLNEAVPLPDSPLPDSPLPDSPLPDSPRLDSPRLDSPRLDSPRLDSPRLESPRPDSPRPDSPRPDSPRPDSPVWVVGVGDRMSGHSEPARATRQLPRGAQALALMHDPASARELAPVPGLTVAAHTHGGQVWIPFVGSAVAPHGWPKDQTHGWVRVGGRPIYITSGLGVSIYPIRINMRPEWVMFRLGDAAREAASSAQSSTQSSAQPSAQ